LILLTFSQENRTSATITKESTFKQEKYKENTIKKKEFQIRNVENYTNRHIDKTR
jgi:hypothetical protein